MGDIQDLKNHYDKKWQELLDVTESEYKGILEYSAWMRYKDKNREYVKLLIEYDQSNPCYGIYFGCKMNVEKKGDDKLEELKEQIWGAYKDRIYPNSSVQMDNVFLPDCEKDCQEKEVMFWFFWIRLDEHLVMKDAIQRLNILIKIFKEQGFTIS